MSIDIGTKFGRFTTIGEIHHVLKGKTKPRLRQYIPCQCQCGSIKDVSVENLVSGRTLGCIKCKTKPLKYGVETSTSLYKRFMGIKQRCENKNYPQWKNYGGRGIKCHWADFGEFYNDMIDGYSEELTIDRIDNDGDYCKENCRWTDRHVQIANQSLRDTNKTGYIGVSIHGEKYLAKVYYRDDVIDGGLHDDAISAAIARDSIILDRGFPHTLNFKQGVHRVN